MDIKAIEDYLNIESQRYPQPTLDALNYYMERFMLIVPFENISVQNKEKISVDLDYLFNKFIYQHRGGFCYEMNHFFGSYLEAKVLKCFECQQPFISLMATTVLKALIYHWLCLLIMVTILLMWDLAIYHYKHSQ